METDQTTPGDADALPAPEIVNVKTRRVACDGGGGALGHPRVFYEIGEENFVECLYCDRRFVLEGGGH
ncbi:MAG: zinc-finger domain-containing protein [Hyphomonadaceae bacterium]|nr:zinc-finger domain-containing protein [Hyphomonadaceae bacterium]